MMNQTIQTRHPLLYVFNLVHAYGSRDLVLRDGSKFEWSSVRYVTFRDGKKGRRFVLDRIEDRHTRIMLGMGGAIGKHDVGKRLIVDEIPGRGVFDYIEG